MGAYKEGAHLKQLWYQLGCKPFVSTAPLTDFHCYEYNKLFVALIGPSACTVIV